MGQHKKAQIRTQGDPLTDGARIKRRKHNSRFFKSGKIRSFRSYYNLVRLSLMAVLCCIYSHVVLAYANPSEAKTLTEHAVNIFYVSMIDLVFITTPIILFNYFVNDFLRKNSQPFFAASREDVLAFTIKDLFLTIAKKIVVLTIFGAIDAAFQYAFYLDGIENWSNSDQLMISISGIAWYNVARFLYGPLFDFFFYATHRILHMKYFYWIHKTHHETKYATIRDSFEFDSIDVLLEGVIPQRIAMFLVCRALGMKMNVIGWAFFTCNIRMMGFAVHIPFYEDLYSRFCDFLVSDKPFGIEAPAQADHSGHHYYQLRNIGTYAIMDRLVGTYACLHELKQMHAERFRRKVIRKGDASHRVAIWSKHAHIFGDLGCDYVRVEEFQYLCMDFGLYMSPCEAIKQGKKLEIPLNPGYISFGKFLDWWLTSHPELSLDEKKIEKRLGAVEIFKIYDTDLDGALSMVEFKFAMVDIKRLLGFDEDAWRRSSGSIFVRCGAKDGNAIAFNDFMKVLDPIIDIVHVN